MAVVIPIISEFDGAGISKAVKQFKQLETAGEKAQFLIKKAAVPAAAALAGVTAALGAAVKAAAEDEQQQAQLALVMGNVTGATDAQIAATEKMIASMSRASGTADAELRPALATLITGTKDVETATTALSLAQDIAIGSNKGLAEVSDALAKAYGGNMKGLQALSPEIKMMIKDGASLDEVMQVLGGTFGGAAAKAADTAAGKFKILKNSISETQESIGAALLPVVQKVLPVLQKFADWAQNNPQAFLAIAGAIAGIAAAVVAVNVAMALGPFGLILTGVGALVVGLVYAYNKFEWFRNGMNTMLNGLISGFELFANSWIGAINIIIRGMNLLNPFTDIPSLPTLSLGRISGGGGGGTAYTGDKDLGVKIPAVPALAAPMVAPAAPLATSGGGGGRVAKSAGTFNAYGGQSYVSGIAERIANRPEVTINVQGGIATSAQIGQSVVDALKQYTQVYGPLALEIA